MDLAGVAKREKEKSENTISATKMRTSSCQLVHLLPLALHPLAAVEKSILLGDSTLTVLCAIECEAVIDAIVDKDTNLLAIRSQVLERSSHKFLQIILRVYFVSKGLLDKIKCFFLLSRLEIAFILGNHFNNQKFTRKVLTKEMNIVQDSLKLGSLQAPVPDIHIVFSRSSDTKIEETSSSVQLLQHSDILGATDR